MKGCLSVRPEYVRNVVKKDGSVVAMLKRCAVSDDSGTIGLTLWGNTIEQVVDNNCYVIEHVCVKKYDLAKCLSTTEHTVVSPAEEVFAAPSEEFLEDLFDVKSISVEKISFAQGLKRWLSCCTCRRQLVKVTGGPEMLVKCVTCNTVQQVSSCSTKACVQVAVEDDDHQLIWLKAFTPIVEEMLRQPAPDVTVQSCEDEIYEQLFDLETLLWTIVKLPVSSTVFIWTFTGKISHFPFWDKNGNTSNTGKKMGICWKVIKQNCYRNGKFLGN